MPNTPHRIGERSTFTRARVSELRAAHDDRHLLLTTPGAVNWLTGGLSTPIDVTASSDPVWCVESDRGRALITSEIEAPRLARDFDLDTLGWELVAVPWFDAEAPLRAALDYCDAPIERLLSDRGDVGSDVTADIVLARMVLSAPEREELRELGSLAARALECSLDEWQPRTSTDFELAATVCDELASEGATPVCLIVGGDDRLRTLRHPLALGAVINEAVMAVVVARRGGLHVAATRIAVTREDDPIIALTLELSRVLGAVMAATRPGSTWGGAVETLASAYGALGQPEAWREHFQGGPIAFEQREFELAPGQGSSPYWDADCSRNCAVAWNPSLRGGAKIEETYLVGEDGPELVTLGGRWELETSEFAPARTKVKVV